MMVNVLTVRVIIGSWIRPIQESPTGLERSAGEDCPHGETSMHNYSSETHSVGDRTARFYQLGST